MSQHDPIDELPPELRALLDAAREPDALAPEVESRMLRALDVRAVAEAAAPSGAGASRGPLARVPWSALVGFVLGALVGAAASRLAAPPRERVITRDRVVTQERVVTRDRVVTVPAPAPAPAPPAVPAAPDVPAPRRDRHVDERDDLAAEQRILDDARLALRGGDAPRALQRLDAHARRFRGGQLAPERELLRVRALVALGRRDEAARVAERFRARYPRHALRPAVEAALR